MAAAHSPPHYACKNIPDRLLGSLFSFPVQFLDPPHHRGHVPHDLIIPESDNPQPQRGQHLLPPFIFLLLQVVDIAIHFNNQPRLVTVEIDDESLNDLLPLKADSQFIRPPKVPEGGNSSHTSSSRQVSSSAIIFTGEHNAKEKVSHSAQEDQ
jgi:hypothetical protein